MSTPMPQNANDFIEHQLDARAESLEKALDADVLAFSGALLFGVDDVIRNVIEEMKGTSQRKKLAVVLTTLGGYIEVVQRIVETLHHHYDIVDFVVPNYAFSAGTVFAMSGDSIYMNYYSRLGPIDPQVEGQDGAVLPALGYLVQWERLLKKAQKGELTTVEAQLMISGFDQAALYKYEQARELSIALLKEWLVKYKFKDWEVTETRHISVTPAMKTKRAAAIARELTKTEKWHSHGSGISMDILRRDLKLRIDDFDKTPDLPGLGKCVKDYYNLLSDYMEKRGNTGVLHRKGKYLPFM